MLHNYAQPTNMDKNDGKLPCPNTPTNFTISLACVPVFLPQQRKLMGSSAQISSGVCRCGSQEQVPEEGSGRFRKVPACAGVGSGGGFRKVPESSGVCWCRFRRRVPEGSDRLVSKGLKGLTLTGAAM